MACKWNLHPFQVPGWSPQADSATAQKLDKLQTTIDRELTSVNRKLGGLERDVSEVKKDVEALKEKTAGQQGQIGSAVAVNIVGYNIPFVIFFICSSQHRRNQAVSMRSHLLMRCSSLVLP